MPSLQGGRCLAFLAQNLLMQGDSIKRELLTLDTYTFQITLYLKYM